MINLSKDKVLTLGQDQNVAKEFQKIADVEHNYGQVEQLGFSFEVLVSNSHFPYILNRQHQSLEHRHHLASKKKAKVVLLGDQKRHRVFKEATEGKDAVDQPDHGHHKVHFPHVDTRWVGCVNQLLVKLLHLAHHDETDPKIKYLADELLPINCQVVQRISINDV